MASEQVASEAESLKSSKGEMHTKVSSRSSLMSRRKERNDRNDNRPKTVYFHGGIGGAGNYRKVSKVNELDVLSPDVPRQQVRRSHFHRFFSSGIGGAGNMHSHMEEASLSEKEELARARARESHGPMRWFVGIGGVGNKRTRRHDSPDSGNRFSNADNSPQYSTEALPYGAADILRRKIFGESSGR